MSALLEVVRLRQEFRTARGNPVTAVGGVSFEVNAGETYGLVGESGSGKSTIGRCLVRLNNPTSGDIVLSGRMVSGRLDRRTTAHLRAKAQMIFQNPTSSLNPRRRVGDIVAEGLRATGRSGPAVREAVVDMLERVGLSAEHVDRFPHQFSGGQRQRIGIARALVVRPDLVIADECVSALDVSIQAQVVNLMAELQRDLGTAYVFIAHDLAMVQHLSHRIGVLHQGFLVETGTTQEIFTGAVHPYTRSLLAAVLSPDPRAMRRRVASAPYDPKALGIDYLSGTEHTLSPTHRVLGTAEQVSAWTS
ncbi:ABC transporter ATP-binding protein [Kineosporia sp. J2-2]|uniref:ABC transporter ATP-binding protein n=1 Tax=Kineosporia corallincola TaxID=2835133 RepID=A0ABS5TRT2_9ACTN|nr:ATP-binding cassette domain-containing protein [Kineosporia corallincola]MBT0773517.1 ABC transporter ATP-binding protein [Kineosporia corallincola]